ncbi:MAG: YchJ family protein [Propionicimonas sp.]
MSEPERCPCGSGAPYDSCCGPLHRGERAARTAVELMRSRYSAFTTGDEAYLLRTWHPRTRPETLELDSGITWLSLQVLDASLSHVEFIARYRGHGGRGFQRERARFEQVGGRWFYVDGTTN